MTESSVFVAGGRDRLSALASEAAAARVQAYRELLGFVPPGDALAELEGSMADRLRALHEWMQGQAPATSHFGPRLSHLMLLGMMVAAHGPASLPQAVAARRNGASPEDVRAVVDLALLFHGLPAAEGGDALLRALSEFERLDRGAGVLAADACLRHEPTPAWPMSPT